jgi:hypothetical protein
LGDSLHEIGPVVRQEHPDGLCLALLHENIPPTCYRS